jgi:hypothetical protein
MPKDASVMTVDELKAELDLASMETAQMELDNLINLSHKVTGTPRIATYDELRRLGKK